MKNAKTQRRQDAEKIKKRIEIFSSAAGK